MISVIVVVRWWCHWRCHFLIAIAKDGFGHSVAAGISMQNKIFKAVMSRGWAALDILVASMAESRLLFLFEIENSPKLQDLDGFQEVAACAPLGWWSSTKCIEIYKVSEQWGATREFP